MASTGFTLCGTCTSEDGAVNVGAWSNPENAAVDDSAYAERNGLGTTADTNFSAYLHAVNFGLAIPDGSSIDGFELRIKGGSSASGRDVKSSQIQLIKGGTRVGDNLTDSAAWGIATLPTTRDFGGSSELASVSWTVADVNSSTFGFAIRFTGHSSATLNTIARVLSMFVNVHYTEDAEPPPSPSSRYMPRFIGI